MIKLIEILQDILAEKKLCPKGRAYYNRRKAAGEKPSAYLSGRAVKVCKGLMEEGSEDEAWELVGQKDLNISKIVKNAGFKYDEESVNKLIPVIEKTPATNISPSQVTKLKNFNNKSGEESLITDIIKISKSQNPRQGYIDLMTKRDSNDSNRQRGYDIGSLYDQVTTGNYEPPVLIDINGTLYVVGGRTRLYASLAANKNIKVKILNSDKLINVNESLRDWFKKEDWVRIDTQGNITGPCGTMKKGKKTTRCLPRAKANSLTKAERAATSQKKAASDKQFVPNTKKAKVKLTELRQIIYNIINESLHLNEDNIDEYDVESSQDVKEFVQFMREYKQPLHEAEYHGRKVQLGKPMQGDVKKFKVYVKNPKGKVVKVNFGFGGSSAKGKRMNIKKNNPKRRKAFRARHNCDSPVPRTKARYWSCRKW